MIERRVLGQRNPHLRHLSGKKLLSLTIVGGITFWATSLATSLLPIAARYRAAFSNWSMQTVWIGSFFMGMIIAFGVSYCLLRFFHKIPVKNPILQSVAASFLALILATLLVDVPMLFQAAGDAVYYFFIGLAFNAVRFLFLGIAVGFLYQKRYG